MKDWCDINRPELSPLFNLVHEYRKWGKLKSTYIDGYRKYINTATGHIHPDIFALSTDTGRMNCQRPNAQNMPRKTNDPIGVRNFIKAPDGHLIISLDFSQIELRVGAFYCRDEHMMETYCTGGDIHAMTTSVIFGVSYEDAQDKRREGYKEQRTIAKNVNFGTFYGLFPRGLQRTLKFKAGVEKTEAECTEIIFMTIDYITGVMCAIADKSLSSEVGFKGICKKVLILMLVGVANIVDIHVVGTGSALRGAVICFYLSNEGLSLLENAAHLGLPVPDRMKEILAQLHDRDKT